MVGDNQIFHTVPSKLPVTLDVLNRLISRETLLHRQILLSVFTDAPLCLSTDYFSPFCRSIYHKSVSNHRVWMKMSLPGASEPFHCECGDCSQIHPRLDDFRSFLDFEHTRRAEHPHSLIPATLNAEFANKSPSDTLAGSDSSTALHPSQNAGMPLISSSAPYLAIPPYAGSSRSDPSGIEGLHGQPNPHSNRQDHIYGQFPASTKDEVTRLTIQSVGSSFGPNTYSDHLRIPHWEFYSENLNSNSTIENEKGYINEGQSSRFNPEGDIDLVQFRDRT
jgi:hypothetical protein